MIIYIAISLATWWWLIKFYNSEVQRGRWNNAPRDRLLVAASIAIAAIVWPLAWAIISTTWLLDDA